MLFMARALSIYNLCSKSLSDAIAFSKQIMKKKFPFHITFLNGMEKVLSFAHKTIPFKIKKKKQ